MHHVGFICPYPCTLQKYFSLGTCCLQGHWKSRSTHSTCLKTLPSWASRRQNLGPHQFTFSPHCCQFLSLRSTLVCETFSPTNFPFLPSDFFQFRQLNVGGDWHFYKYLLWKDTGWSVNLNQYPVSSVELKYFRSWIYASYFFADPVLLMELLKICDQWKNIFACKKGSFWLICFKIKGGTRWLIYKISLLISEEQSAFQPVLP